MRDQMTFDREAELPAPTRIGSGDWLGHWSNRTKSMKKANSQVGKKCKCELCTKWSPLHRRIMAKLRGKDKKLFDEFLMMVWNDSDDLGAANAKLAGDWPGWEWMPEIIKQKMGEVA